MFCLFPYPKAYDPEEFARIMFRLEIPSVFADLDFILLRDATSALRYLLPLRSRLRAEVTFVRKASTWGVHIRAATPEEEELARHVVTDALKGCQRNFKIHVANSSESGL
jgi:hypothetical protein